MALPLACEVRRKALLGAKQTLRAGLAKAKESTHLAAGRSKTRRPPSRSAAASQRPSELNAMSVAGTPQAKERTTAAPCRSTTSRPPSSRETATRAPWARRRRQLGKPERSEPRAMLAKGACVMTLQSFRLQSPGCDDAETTLPSTVIARPQTRPRWARGGGGAAAPALALGLPAGGSSSVMTSASPTISGGFGSGPRCSPDWRLNLCRAPFSSPMTQ
mmetsp:Transcript_87142/g.247066  ORF Transcript_87142/g.247066 Transcript_87142/m.247066 type:complete len:218 (-) Transcript_87142:757-1410(-)